MGSGKSTFDCAYSAARRSIVQTMGTSVLTHFVPSDDPTLTDEMWAGPARSQFNGKVIVGKDLMEL